MKKAGAFPGFFRHPDDGSAFTQRSSGTSAARRGGSHFATRAELKLINKIKARTPPRRTKDDCMPPDREQVVAKLRQDHEYMLQLMRRITALCDLRETVENCRGCVPIQRSLCRENIEQLIRAFVDVTLRHNLIESACMDDDIPREHRIAHKRAHMAIAEDLKAIRLVFARDGNGIVAIEGIERAFGTLSTHLTDYDEPLERYLLATA